MGLPPGMSLVRTEYLNLDLGGEGRDFNVPGFEGWSGEGGFQDPRRSRACS